LAELISAHVFAEQEATLLEVGAEAATADGLGKERKLAPRHAGPGHVVQLGGIAKAGGDHDAAGGFVPVHKSRRAGVLVGVEAVA